MIKDKSILAIIPARGGSKGVPRKNIRELVGKPLIAWTIEAAGESKYLDRVIISSEDDEIINIAKRWGGDVPFKRPAELAKDHTSSIDVICQVIDILPQYDYVVMLQPTSPLRTGRHIDECIELFFETKAESCVSVTKAEVNPYWMYTISDDNRMVPLLPIDIKEFHQRQKLPKVYQLNGAIYVSSVEVIKEKKSFITSNTISYIMSKESSIDVDSEMDFKFLETVLELRATIE